MENLVDGGGPHMVTWRMCISCWITKATNTHSHYVILIAFPLPLMVARKRLNITLYVHCCLVVNAEEAKSKGPFSMV